MYWALTIAYLDIALGVCDDNECILYWQALLEWVYTHVVLRVCHVYSTLLHSIHNVVHLHLRQVGAYSFEVIHTQRMGK